MGLAKLSVGDTGQFAHLEDKVIWTQRDWPGAVNCPCQRDERVRLVRMTQAKPVIRLPIDIGCEVLRVLHPCKCIRRSSQLW